MKISNQKRTPTCIEICSGAGGQALGLEMAGFEALAHVENDRHACATLRQNRPAWNVLKKCRVISDQWEDWKHRLLRWTQILRTPENIRSKPHDLENRSQPIC